MSRYRHVGTQASRHACTFPKKWLRDRLRAGAIQTVREPSGRYLFPDSEGTLEALRQLRARVVKQVDLMPSRLQHQEHHHV